VTTSDSAPCQATAKLRGAIAGDVFVPGEHPYDRARQAWDLLADQRPAAVMLAESAVQSARALGKRIAPQGTGPRGQAHVPSRAGRAALPAPAHRHPGKFRRPGPVHLRRAKRPARELRQRRNHRGGSRTRPEDGCAAQPPRCGTPRHTSKPTGMRSRSPHRATAAGLSDWRDRAACRHADPELFFPISTDGPSLDQTRHAKRVCAGCPVRAACLAWALAHPGTSGIWGGTTEDERRVLAGPPTRQSRVARPRAFPRHGRQESP
jgi:WhiB family transcriptional regulator, redox-sensing transcriptional regulator